MPDPDQLVLTATAPANGGAALARHPDGRVVFIEGALPGERVAVVIHEDRRDYLRATAAAVLEPAPDRVVPPCPQVAAGCGGCDLQHLAPAAQPALKQAVVTDALRRIGRLPDVWVEAAPALPSTGFRTTVRAAVTGGRAGFRRRRGHDVVVADSCLVAHPMVEALLAGGRFGGCDEVTVRVGASTGDRLVVASPSAGARAAGSGRDCGVELPDDLAAGTCVVGDDELDRGRRAWIHEDVAGRRLRISARSFFQTCPDGAAALVEQVRRAGGDELAAAGRVVDAYAGVGLFAATVVPAGAGAAVTVVESSASAVADARHNLVTGPAGDALAVRVVRAAVERWRPRPADVVIADPPRAGLGRGAVPVLAGTGAPVLVLVSCDAASLARDTRLLAGHGFRHELSVVVDLFPHTHHVEVVSRFAR